MDNFRTGFTAALLNGAARGWVTSYLENNDPILNNWESFESVFTAMFDGPHRRRTASTKIAHLLQGSRTVSIYAAEFRRIAMDIAFDDASLAHWFGAGLSNDVFDELVHLGAKSELNDLIAQVI